MEDPDYPKIYKLTEDKDWLELSLPLGSGGFNFCGLFVMPKAGEEGDH